MKKIVLLSLLVPCALAAMAQSQPAGTPAPVQKVSVTPYGFIRNYLSYDSRSTYFVNGGEYNIMPYDEQWNLPDEYAVNGEASADANDYSTLRFQAISTRFGFNLTGPSLFGAKSTGKIEADFCGFGTSNTVLRIRLAYMKLEWERHEILCGQDWHPINGGAAYQPEVLGMAAGAPFSTINRSPQLRYNYKMNGGLGFTAAAIYQMQYTSSGPDGASANYANRDMIPELFGGISLTKGSFYMQVAADFLSIRPRVTAEVPAASDPSKMVTIKVNDRIATVSPTFYAQYKEGALSIKFRSIYGQNVAHLNLMSGYGISAINDDGSQDYTPLRSTINFFNIAYGKKVKANLFLGYMKNLGTKDNLIEEGMDALYTKNNKCCNIGQMMRIAPSVSYNIANFTLGLEYEYTLVEYGKIGVDGKLIAGTEHNVPGHRICGLVKYSF
ncbi:MAG: hypothetical protein KBT04_00190 [Bacteroidales bacterium]|nr:hypothetical protein [Candidatus Colimorpha onthohippi]